MVSTLTSFDSLHEDMIHDAQMDFYGRRLATASSDRTIRLFEVEGDKTKPLDILKGHAGPVWQVSWSHPKYENLLASCSYDSKVLIWKEVNGTWAIIKEHTVHEASVNSISWAPHEYGLMLLCGSSDGKVSILSCKAGGHWDSQCFQAHQIGCNSIAWEPASSPIPDKDGKNFVYGKRFASAGCDNLIKIWRFDEDKNCWNSEEKPLEEHTDWVRDIAWAPYAGSNSRLLASCSQDKTVIIWKQDNLDEPWTKINLKGEKFSDVVWRLSWSLTGSILAVSSADSKVSLWKESLTGKWECVNEIDENVAAGEVVPHNNANDK